MTQPTLLLVDSDDGARRALAELLNDSGLCVLEMSRGEQVVPVASERTIGMVILEPWPSVPMYLEMIDHLRTAPETRHIPIVALTSAAAAEHRERLLAAGCDAYLEKPCSPEELLATIRRVLGPVLGAERACGPSGQRSEPRTERRTERRSEPH